ncbi:transcriptional regulator NrdR [candidate division KSB1 bacterium]|nr:MAG: transcriptional regulator NrdR [candidate division KSB1 bacterium]
MKCPYCGNIEDRVIDSRSVKDNEFIRRRRECLKCGERFTTYEYIVKLSNVVVKNDGRREDFSREKLARGIEIACAKRPISKEKIENIVKKIEDKIQANYPKEIKSKVIGEMVMKELKQIDEIAYVRFASVYRKFEAKEEFIKELEELEKPVEQKSQVELKL